MDRRRLCLDAFGLKGRKQKRKSFMLSERGAAETVVNYLIFAPLHGKTTNHIYVFEGA